MARYGEQLRDEGIEVLSAWMTERNASSDGFSGLAPGVRAMLAMDGISSVMKSNAVVLFSDQRRPSGALQMVEGPCHLGTKQVEFGLGLGLGKRLLIVGAAENIYHELPDVERFDLWAACFARIIELRGSDGLTTRDAAAETHATRTDVVGWIRSGKLPAVKNPDGEWVIARNDLDILKAQRQRAAAQRAERGTA